MFVKPNKSIPIQHLKWPGFIESISNLKKRKLLQQPLPLFPDPSTANQDGILGYSFTMNSAMLYSAYREGIFPWPSSDPHIKSDSHIKSEEDIPILWFCPWQRGILNFSELHISESLKKFLRKNPYEVTINKNFSDVILACSQVPREGQQGTWITKPLIEAYNEFHELGFAHSVEVWKGNELVGGIYGVFVENVFSGESMFRRQDNASKVALLFLIEKLKELGLHWMDIQMVTPITQSFGGRLVTQSEYLKMLKQSQSEFHKKF